MNGAPGARLLVQQGIMTKTAPAPRCHPLPSTQRTAAWFRKVIPGGAWREPKDWPRRITLHIVSSLS